jgi:probable HAF family extracellular repeat protein
MVGLGTLPGALGSHAFGISADGSVIVGESGLVAFKWTEAIRMQALQTAFGSASGANGVSADGSVIAGYFQLRPGVDSEAARWTAAYQGLGDLPDGDFASYAHGVSADGAVVFGVGNGDNGVEGFRWENGTMTGLGFGPVGSGNSQANAASADGSVIVGNSGGFAARWTQATGWVGLGSLSGSGNAPGGEAKAVSADGSVIVGTIGFAQTGFIWDSTNGMRDLKALLQAHGNDLSGWVFLEPLGISADGRTIVGTGQHGSSPLEAWVATIPEPGTLGTAVFGLLVLLESRRRARGCNRT